MSVKSDTLNQTPKTRGQETAADIVALLRARNPLLWIVTREEARAESLIFEAGRAAGYFPHFWDIAQGGTELDGKPIQGSDPDPRIMFDTIRAKATTGETRDLWVMRDLPTWLDGLSGAVPLRSLRNLARFLPSVPKSRAQAIIVLSPVAKVPDELSNHATVIEWPMPDRAEIAGILDAIIGTLSDDMRDSAAPNGTRDAAIDAAIGLTGEEAQACYARSLVQFRKIDPAAVAKEKRRVIARERVLEWYDPIPGGLDAVGGLDVLKSWLIARKAAYSAKARAYGLPAPKGCLLAGIPGCGKSLTAKAIATAWSVPLLRLDMGGLKSKFVGDSEANLRKAFKVIEAIGRCVVWIDEIEKALAGATQGAADGGVSSDALGQILSWMQERQGEAFVIATANDIESLPPELLRKGRFDELWFVDLPNDSERVAILQAALKSHGRASDGIDLESIADKCQGFTGSELAALVPDALFMSFNDGQREIQTPDLMQAASTVVPLSKTMPEKIAKLKAWANGKARLATSVQVATGAAKIGRELDF